MNYYYLPAIPSDYKCHRFKWLDMGTGTNSSIFWFVFNPLQSAAIRCCLPLLISPARWYPWILKTLPCPLVWSRHLHALHVLHVLHPLPLPWKRAWRGACCEPAKALPSWSLALGSEWGVRPAIKSIASLSCDRKACLLNSIIFFYYYCSCSEIEQFQGCMLFIVVLCGKCMEMHQTFTSIKPA